MTSFLFLSFPDFRKTRTAVVICFVLFIARNVDAQTYSFRHYSTSEGLNSSTVYSCTKDSKGFMWFCTDAGVARFDGKQFEQFTATDGLSDNEVFKAFEDSKGRIWFLTLNGHLSYFKNEKFYNEKNDALLRNTFLGESYTSGFEDSDGNIYLGTFGSPFIVIKGNRISVYRVPSAYGTFSFFERKPGEIYMASAIRRVSLKNGKLIDAPLKNVRRDVRYVHVVDGEEYHFCNNGLIKMNGDSEELIISSDLLPRWYSITGCIQTTDSEFIISTRGEGAILYSRKNGVYYKKQDAILKDKIILSVYIDNENNTWFNTEGNGVYMISDASRNVKSYTGADGLTDANISRLIKDNSGNLWAAGGKHTVSKITPDTIINYSVSAMGISKNDRILDMAFDRYSVLWIATDFGLVKFLPGVFNYTLPLHFEERNEYTSCKAITCTNDEAIYISYFMGVARLQRSANGKEDFLMEEKGAEYGKRTYTHFVDSDNRLWVADINGLNVMQDHRMICFGSKDPLLKNRIVQIREIRKSLVLVTSENGIVLFSDGRIIKHITRKDGLASDICRKVFCEGNRIWVATNRGLAEIYIKNDSTYAIKNYDETSGLLSADVHDVVVDGRYIYVATDKGLSVLDNTIAQKKLNPPEVYITRINVNNVNHEMKGELSLDYTENSVALNFIAVTYQNPEKVVYQYRLNGSESGWITTHNNSIEFSGLSPAHYTFSLRAKKINSGWSDPVQLHFIINPPFWKTGWFIFVSFFTALFALFFAQRIYAKRKLQRQLAEMTRREIILSERSRISSDMHDDLGADLSRIVLLSEVMKAKEKINEQTSGSLDKISKCASDLREKVDEIIWALNPRHDTLADLVSYIHNHSLDYFDGSTITHTMILPDEIPVIYVSAAFRRNFFLIVKESLQNILKHSKATSVEVSLIAADSFIEIIMQDNGRGFNVENKPHRGNGLNNMHKRAAEINGRVQIITSEGNGCRIILRGSLNQGYLQL